MLYTSLGIKYVVTVGVDKWITGLSAQNHLVSGCGEGVDGKKAVDFLIKSRGDKPSIDESLSKNAFKKAKEFFEKGELRHGRGARKKGAWSVWKG